MLRHRSTSPTTTTSANTTSSGSGWGSLFFGFLLGIAGYVFYRKREQVLALTERLTHQFKDKK
jgi:LPXTG-motif cell wall-anchored protein